MTFNRIFPPSMFSHYWDEIKAVIKECEASNKQVHILVEAEKKKRSLGVGSQNHHLNGHIQQIAMFTGQPFEDIKKYIKQQAISMGYPMLERFGRPVTDLWGNPIGISEKDSTTAQCAMLIEASHQLAAELGILLQESEYED